MLKNEEICHESEHTVSEPTQELAITARKRKQAQFYCGAGKRFITENTEYIVHAQEFYCILIH